MQKISADYIFPISSPPIANGVLVVDDKGYIEQIGQLEAFDQSNLIHYSGILCPGFVNAHCHLELSHLKGRLPIGTGLVNFLKPIKSIREEYTTVDIQAAIIAAEEEMLENGIVAVGDISNDATSFFQKEKENLLYYHFIEVFGIHEHQAAAIIKRAGELKKELQHNASVVPHAPYSVSKALFQQIKNLKAPLLSIHNQESAAENELFLEGKGDFMGMFESLGMTDFPNVINKNSIHYTTEQLELNTKLILVHNTFTTQADISVAQAFSQALYWCFCPNANLYIEDRLPDFHLFRKNKAKIVLGTDSLTSNWQLSILEEMKCIQQAAPSIPLVELLEWACLNGAEALGFDTMIGSLEIGKKPGIVHLTNVEIPTFRLSKKSKARRIV